MNRDLTGLVTDFKRFAVHDGDGVRTTVFLKGCPLRCLWCHNPEGLLPEPELAFYEPKCLSCGECAAECPAGVHTCAEDGHTLSRMMCLACGTCEEICPASALKLYGRRMTVREVIDIVLEDRMFYRETGGMTLSGGEPTMQPAFALALLQAAKEEGINTALDTCGFAKQDIYERLIPVTDTFLFDLKHIDGTAHIHGTGQPNRIILDNLRYLSDAGARIEIRIPVIPGYNTDEQTMTDTAKFLGTIHTVGVRLLPYHDFARSKYQALHKTDTMPEAERPTEELLGRYEEILVENHVNRIH